MDFVIVFLGEYLGYILIAAFLVFWLENKNMHPWLLWELFAAAVLSRGIITETIRLFWHRARPFVEQNFVPMIPHADSASFPSGHATFFFAVGTVLYMHNKKAGTVFLLGSALIGVARVLAGVHWPSDVIAGALIGVACGLVVSKFAILLYRRRFLIESARHAN